MDGATIYILRCDDGSFYVGITRRSVEERVGEHNAGAVEGYTCRRRPVELIFSEHYERIADAVAAERRIKGWSRDKKISYMRGDFEALRELSVSRRKAMRGAPASLILSLSKHDMGPSNPAQDEEV